MHAGGGVAAKWANSKGVDYRVSTTTARNARRCPQGSSCRGYLGRTALLTDRLRRAVHHHHNPITTMTATKMSSQ
jgi:hypothetical protein